MKIKDIINSGEERTLFDISVNGEKDFADSKWYGEFNCQFKNLTSLEGAPSEINGSFFCGNNKLKSLKGSPNKVTLDFGCSSNNLVTFEGGPKEIGRDIFCDSSRLNSLRGIPSIVHRDLSGRFNFLSSFEGFPSTIGRNLIISDNKFRSLEGIHTHIKEIGHLINLFNNPIKSHVLGLLKIKGLKIVVLSNKDVEFIINKHLQNEGNIYDCQEELINAGFEEYAQLWE